MNTIIMGALLFLSQSWGSSADEKIIIKVIEDIEIGWEKGDGSFFRKHFLDFGDARYFESGGQNVGLADLISHHVEPEKKALEYLNLDFKNIKIHFFHLNLHLFFFFPVSLHFFLFVFNYLKGKVRKSWLVFDKTGHETFLFRKINNEWRVLHTHSSSRDSKPEKMTK